MKGQADIKGVVTAGNTAAAAGHRTVIANQAKIIGMIEALDANGTTAPAMPSVLVRRERDCSSTASSPIVHFSPSSTRAAGTCLPPVRARLHCVRADANKNLNIMYFSCECRREPRTPSCTHQHVNCHFPVCPLMHPPRCVRKETALHQQLQQYRQQREETM